MDISAYLGSTIDCLMSELIKNKPTFFAKQLGYNLKEKYILYYSQRTYSDRINKYISLYKDKGVTLYLFEKQCPVHHDWSVGYEFKKDIIISGHDHPRMLSKTCIYKGALFEAWCSERIDAIMSLWKCMHYSMKIALGTKVFNYHCNELKIRLNKLIKNDSLKILEAS